MAKFKNKNFRVESDADGWEKINIGGVSCLGNPEADIMKIAEGEYKGEQLFTLAAAIREVAKAGKIMPAEEDFKSFKKRSEIPNLVLVGYSATGLLLGQGKSASFWSAEGGYAQYENEFPYRAKIIKKVGVSSYIANQMFFSVRCLNKNI